MAEYEFFLPQLGMQMTEATIEEWLFADGETVGEGEDVVIIATDKVDTALQAPAAGVIHPAVEDGDTVAVGALLATIVTGDGP